MSLVVSDPAITVMGKVGLTEAVRLIDPAMRIVVFDNPRANASDGAEVTQDASLTSLSHRDAALLQSVRDALGASDTAD